jgi:hypothetical protein
VTVVKAEGKEYEIKVTSSPATQTFSIKRASTGLLTYPCTAASKGGCPSTLSWANG